MNSTRSNRRGLHSVAFGTLLSRVLGFIRDLVIARLFGATIATDAFVIAFRIPNLMRRLFAEGTLALALVPQFTTYQARNDIAGLHALADRILGTLALLLAVLTLLGLVAAPLLVLLFAPGFDPGSESYTLTLTLLRLCLPYLFFIGLTAVAGAVLNSYQHFLVPALTPALLNLSIIGSALLLAPQLEQPMVALAVGVLLGGMVQCAVQWPFVRRLGWRPRLRLGWRDSTLRTWLNSLLPTLLGASVTQLNLLIDSLLASLLIAGTISWLYYAERLMEFPLGLLGVALGIWLTPQLTRWHITAAPENFSATLNWALRWVILLGLPAAVGLAVLASPILALLFASAEFGLYDVEQAAWALRGYAVALPPLLLVKVLAPAFYSRADHRTPLIIGGFSVALNLGLSLALMPLLGHAGIALATAIASGLQALLLLRALHQTGVSATATRNWLLHSAIAAALMGVGLVLIVPSPAEWITQNTTTAVLNLTGFILGGASGYGLLLWLLRPRYA